MSCSLIFMRNYIAKIVIVQYICLTLCLSREIKRASPQYFTVGVENLFDKIVRKQVPCDFLHEDDICVAFDDVSPQAPEHFLVVSKKKILSLSKAADDDAHILGHMMIVAKKVAAKKNLDGGFRVVVNNGKDTDHMEPHLHLHVLGGRIMHWPPG